MSAFKTKLLCDAINRGASFAYPTDTIWGFGCHPLHFEAVDNILTIKNRPMSKGLILLSSKLSWLLPYLDPDLTEDDHKLIATPQSKPTTWLVPAHQDCPVWLKGNHPTIAVRITDHPFVTAVCESLNSPLVSTSANRAGRSPIRTPFQGRLQFANELDFIVAGFDTGGAKASQIKSLQTGTTHRN